MLCVSSQDKAKEGGATQVPPECLLPSGVQLASDGDLVFEEASKDVLGEGKEVAEVLQVSERKRDLQLHSVTWASLAAVIEPAA